MLLLTIAGSYLVMSLIRAIIFAMTNCATCLGIKSASRFYMAAAAHGLMWPVILIKNAKPATAASGSGCGCSA